MKTMCLMFKILNVCNVRESVSQAWMPVLFLKIYIYSIAISQFSHWVDLSLVAHFIAHRNTIHYKSSFSCTGCLSWAEVFFCVWVIITTAWWPEDENRTRRANPWATSHLCTSTVYIHEFVSGERAFSLNAFWKLFAAQIPYFSINIHQIDLQALY